jgi:hypothetical protein
MLSGAGAEAVLAPERVAPSTIYDLQYRVIINALVFERLAKSYQGSVPRVQAAKQKLAQFVAIRPWLVSVVRDWSATQHVPQLSMNVSQRLRRGFLGDAMHESVMEFLIAGGVFRRDGAHLSAGANGQLVEKWTNAALTAELFSAERAAIEQLSTITITNAMLEGW